jgi:hypothetical protein
MQGRIRTLSLAAAMEQASFANSNLAVGNDRQTWSIRMTRNVFFSFFLTIGIGCGLASAQTGNGGNDNGGGTTPSPNAAAGVHVNADGVLSMRLFPDATGRLTKQRLEAMRAQLDPEVARPSKLRKVSLTRLESLIKERLENGAGITDDMRNLVGLTRLQYVFFYPETKEIVIAGPAEGYAADVTGRIVGLNSGQAVLQLEDLVTAIRCFPPQGKATQVIGCSIDPTEQGLARMRDFLVQIAGRIRPSDDQRIATGLRESLGLQKVTVKGVPTTSHFAQVLVEADYRMKLIGIGKEIPPVKISTYVQKARPSDVARNALQRWYFVPDYDAVKVSDDELAMELVGKGVKLVGEQELVSQDGRRSNSGFIDRASQAFVTSFTSKYEEIARRSPVFGQLRNLIDMAIATAFLQKYDYYGKADWDVAVFGSESVLPVELYPAPEQVASAVNVIWKGNTLMTPIGGGVNIQATQALDRSNLIEDTDGEVNQAHKAIDMNSLPVDRWWWD